MRLYIWSGGEPADLAKIKAAKLSLEEDEFTPWATPLPKVVPTNCGRDGHPEMTWEDRVLAIDSAPPFLCDYFLVGADAGPEEFTRAMAWVMKLEVTDERANLVGDTMAKVFGPGTREISEEEQLANQKLYEYQHNLGDGERVGGNRRAMFEAAGRMIEAEQLRRAWGV